MKVAITEWQGRIAPVFDVAGTAWIIDQNDDRRSLSLLLKDARVKLEELKEHGVTVLICGAISKPVQEYAVSMGIRVNAFTSGEMEDVWNAWKDGTLNNACYAMPGCDRCRRRKGQCK